PLPRGVGARRLAREGDHTGDFSTGPGPPGQVHEEGETPRAVADEEDLAAGAVPSNRADRRRSVEETERLEIRSEAVALARPVPPQVQHPAVEALLGQIGREARAEGAVR